MTPPANELVIESDNDVRDSELWIVSSDSPGMEIPSTGTLPDVTDGDVLVSYGTHGAAIEHRFTDADSGRPYRAIRSEASREAERLAAQARRA